MSKKWFWVLLVIFIVGGFASGLLYRRYRTLLTQKPAKTPPPAQNFGSAIITYSSANPNQKEYLRTVVINKLTVEDFSLDVVEVKGEKKPLLNLVVSFNYQGKDRKLIIPIVDDILLRKVGPVDFEEGEVKSVESLNLKKGALVNVAFSYIPKEKSVKKKELSEFCGRTDYRACLMYIEFGFGDNPVDFDAYLQNVLGKQDTAQLDYKVSFPNTIFVLAN